MICYVSVVSDVVYDASEAMISAVLLLFLKLLISSVFLLPPKL